MDVDSVDFDAFVGSNQNVFDSVENACLNEITAFRIDTDGDVRCADLELLRIDNVLWANLGSLAEGFLIFLFKGSDMFLSDIAGREYLPHRFA